MVAQSLLCYGRQIACGWDRQADVAYGWDRQADSLWLGQTDRWLMAGTDRQTA